MHKPRLLFLFLLLLSFGYSAHATHIAGAELYYSCTGNNLYNVRLVMYRDCQGGQAPFDNPITLFVFNRTTGGLHTTINVPVPTFTPYVVPENWDACVATPYNLCVEKATYSTSISLPPNSAGYYFAWARCCRNNIITNLADPECEGVTFLAHVPPATVASCNSMPVFKNTPSIFLCAGRPYYFDYSATDADGDSLVYEISNPFTGLNTSGQGAGNNNGSCGPNPSPVVDLSNLMGPAPYRNVVYAPGHNFLNPFGPGGSININHQTGYLEAFPPNIGVYVVAVSVKEYRNGVLLSENKRDFQFHVIACNPQGPPPVLTTDLSGLTTNGDTIIAEAGRPFCFDFNVTDPQAPSYIQVKPVSVIFGGNGGFPPPYATWTANSNIPPVMGEICWTPACQYAGSAIPVMITARDTNDCPNYNIVFDTVWIRVVPSPSVPPVVTHDLGTLPTNGDTIILGIQENFCYNFYVVDTLGGADLAAENLIKDLNGNILPQTHTVNTYIQGDTLFGEVCWQTACNYGMEFMFVTRGYDEFQCPPGNTNWDTVWLRIPTPPNPPPILNTDISTNPVINDTIQALVFEEICFNFAVLDTSGIGDTLTFAYELRDLNGNLAPGFPPSYLVTGSQDSIGGILCWKPNCDNVDGTYMFIVRGIQFNGCQIQADDRDTIYVHVSEQIKPKPLISHDLGQGPTNNTTLQVADNDTFCYTFTLQDTVTPTELRYELTVYDPSGQPFTASQPTLTYTTALDSLLEGTICWSVPCELSNQNFTIIMKGRDTTDCRTSNTVWDTVYIQHTETPPAPINLCNVSVLPGDASISLDWTPGTENDLVGYYILRKAPESATFTILDSITGASTSTYIDTQGINADQGSYCYQILAIDRCGATSALGSSMCTVLLTALTQDYSSSLSWSPFTDWPLGTQSQDIYRNYPALPGNPSELVINLSSIAFSHTDATITQPRNCYRIRANSIEGDCAIETWSNEVCLDFPATLFVPTAFTPNGDGLNDFFTSFGEFEKDFEMQIYDRWGKLIFASQTQYPGWNGEIDGSPVPEGVYVFRIKVTGFTGDVLERSGSVTLYR